MMINAKEAAEFTVKIQINSNSVRIRSGSSKVAFCIMHISANNKRIRKVIEVLHSSSGRKNAKAYEHPIGGN